MDSSNHSLDASPPPPHPAADRVVDVEWTPVGPPPALPASKPLVVRFKRRGVARARAPAPVMARGRCMVCGKPARVKPVKVGPFKAQLCQIHATSVSVAAMIMRSFFG